MALPQFPSQDLAKLVLGYLAEEQLMTAYDEFLQASPHLDANRNEYDRIFMTSLKNILAEYRAVKIYVESCKPVSLRRKLFQCTNLLEVVKFLIALIDTQKLNCLEVNDKLRCKENVKIVSNCNCKPITSCTCKVDQKFVTYLEAPYKHTNVVQNSTDTRYLSELPGNIKENISKQVSVVNDIQTNESDLNDNMQQSPVEQHIINNELTNNSLTNSVSDNELKSTSQTVLEPETSKKNLEEFDSIFDRLAKNGAEGAPNETILNAGTFQEFAKGVIDKQEVNNHCQTAYQEQPVKSMTYTININKNSANLITNIKGPPIPKIVIEPKTNTSQENVEYIGIEEKNTEKKIAILSDIKVDNTFTNKSHVKKPPILKTATSTPLLQMQTLYINGMPAYKNPDLASNYPYTKDEIMAMPTIILVPASGKKPNSKKTLNENLTNDKQNLKNTKNSGNFEVLNSTVTSVKVNISHPLNDKNDGNSHITSDSAKILEPLTIDVKTNASIPREEVQQCNNLTVKGSDETGLVKIVDVVAASLPKDITATGINKASTPHSLPPTRKSSSTPRRSSHIRVLDFTTPRRILNETSSNQNTINTTNIPVKTCVIQEEVNNKVVNDENNGNNRNQQNTSQINKQYILSDKNTIKPKKKPNWDADLRALIVKSDSEDTTITQKSKKHVKQIGNKTNKNDKRINNQNKEKKITNQKSSPKRTKTKKTGTEKTVIDTYTEKLKTSESMVKPNISIITENPKIDNQTQENINKRKNDNSNEETETPEIERLALQNVIDAKLNISELLETPYKQALYDIQMETPRFLGPELPDEPVSDIKIMNIPTPRFFDTPRQTQATPSSYSRPTDYSSGGSYYKPDDQDYIHIAEVLECAITVTKDKNENSVEEKSLEEEDKKPRRPIRKCTKNVSYSKKNNTSKRPKDDFKSDTASSSSDLSNNINFEKKIQKLSTKATSNKKVKSKSLLENKIRHVEIRISPLKRETQKNFMKIKPRRTPIKKQSVKQNKKSIDLTQHASSDTQVKKRQTSKDKSTNLTAGVVAAPTKSRRKSATPRKLHCTKSFNSESADQNSPKSPKAQPDVTKIMKSLCPQDSDNEHPPLRWSDDGSQETKLNASPDCSASQNEDDDIEKIQKYIENTVKARKVQGVDNSLHFDLIKRGFDAETAKIIERDLLDTPPRVTQTNELTSNEDTSSKIIDLNTSNSKSDASINIQSDDGEDEEEVELTTSDCCEDSKNYIKYTFDETKFAVNNNLPGIKHNYCMELVMDEEVTIRLHATPFKCMFDQEPRDALDECYVKETETAILSISNIHKLYTPLKDRRSQCYEIFDSTLTSLDTPLKPNTSKEQESEVTITDIILEVENVECKEKTETRKRKRNQSVVLEDSANTSKKLKPEAQYLLNSANIQNMDIESVLSKLHGP